MNLNRESCPVFEDLRIKGIDLVLCIKIKIIILIDTLYT